MGKYEVTRRQWQSVVGSNPSEFYCTAAETARWRQVSWNDVQQFIQEAEREVGRADGIGCRRRRSGSMRRGRGRSDRHLRRGYNETEGQ